MAFSNTLTVTVNAVAKVLNRINQDGYGSEYLLRESTGEYRVKVRHSTQKPAKPGGRDLDRHNFELTHTVYATATDKEIVRTMYFVYVVPKDDNLTTVGYLASSFGNHANTVLLQTDLLNWMS